MRCLKKAARVAVAASIVMIAQGYSSPGHAEDFGYAYDSQTRLYERIKLFALRRQANSNYVDIYTESGSRVTIDTGGQVELSEKLRTDLEAGKSVDFSACKSWRLVESGCPPLSVAGSNDGRQVSSTYQITEVGCTISGENYPKVIDSFSADGLQQSPLQSAVGSKYEMTETCHYTHTPFHY